MFGATELSKPFPAPQELDQSNRCWLLPLPTHIHTQWGQEGTLGYLIQGAFQQLFHEKVKCQKACMLHVCANVYVFQVAVWTG